MSRAPTVITPAVCRLVSSAQSSAGSSQTWSSAGPDGLGSAPAGR
ncbi:hypothetical protein ACFQQB_61660 [Nonomuraea rubra]